MTEINAQTHLYGVVGNPVAHSMSPVMHNAAFQSVGYNGVYLAFCVDDVAAAVCGMKAFGIKGLSVTIPHKEAVIDCLDEVDGMALKIGAVNTIVNNDGRLVGFNSDVSGAVKALREKTDVRGRRVVIAGAGGAARAIGFGIVEEGGNLAILNRSISSGEKLASDIGADFYPLSECDRVPCDIFINATSLGMTPHVETSPVPLSYLEKGMTVMDIVYNPLETTLLKDAAKAGCDIIDGLSMFVYQGVAQFEMWTGEKAPADLMRRTVLNSLTVKRGEM